MDKTLVQFKIEATKRKVTEPLKKFWNGTKKAASEAWDWAKENPTEAIVVVSAVAGGVYKTARIITRNREVRHEEYIAECRFYDPRMGEYVFSDKKLSNAEKLRFDDLYKKGYTKREALNIMGRIKY